MPLPSTELPDGRQMFCQGFRDGLPWWGWGEAPAGLVTKTQLREQGLRRSRGQCAVGLLVFRKHGCGEQVAQLFEVDEAIESRPMSPRWRAAIERACQAHKVCRGCGREFQHYLSSKTWRCWPCMEKTGDFGQPDGIDIAV